MDIAIIERTDDNEKEVVAEIREFIRKYIGLSEGEIQGSKIQGS